MKTKLFMTMAATALIMAGCSNDETDNWAGEIRLTSGLDVQQVSRAASNIQTAQFDEGESIDVFISENVSEGKSATTVYDQPLVYKIGASGTMNSPANNQPYFPTSGNKVNIYAYYPSDIVSSLTDPATINFTVKADQSGDENYKKSDLMYGIPSSNPVARTSLPTNLTFTHLLSKVTVTLIAGVGTPDLEGATVKFKSVNPTTTLTPATGTISEASGTAIDITVLNASGANLSGSAILVPQTLPDSFIEVTLANGGVLTSDLSGVEEVTFAGSNEYKYTITVNLTSLDITTSISAWGDGADGSGNAVMK